MHGHNYSDLFEALKVRTFISSGFTTDQEVAGGGGGGGGGWWGGTGGGRGEGALISSSTVPHSGISSGLTMNSGQYQSVNLRPISVSQSINESINQ